MNIQKYFISVILLISAVGCSSSDKVQCFDLPPDRIGESVQDDSLQMALLDNDREFHNDDSVFIFVENMTDHSIWIPNGYNLEMYYISEDGEKVFLTDVLDRELMSDHLLGSKNSDTSNTAFIVVPENGGLVPREVTVTVWGLGFRDQKYCNDKHGGSISITILP